MAHFGADLTVNSDDDGHLVVVGEVDAHTAGRLDDALGSVDADRSSLRVDLSGVGFMDSSGLRVLLAAVDRCREQGGDLVLVAPSAGVRRVIDVSGLGDHFTIDG